MRISLLVFVLTASALALADGPEQARPVVGKCQGGLRPSVRCTTCAHCAYCGKTKGRAANSGTCAVCEKAAKKQR